MSKINIRLAERGDVKAIIEIYEPFITDTAITFDEVIPTEDEMWSRIQHIQAEHPYMVCTIDDQVAGYAYYSEYRSRASYRWAKEISVYIHPEFYRRNIARALYTVLFDLARLQNLTTLLAIITIPNDPSILFHERLGFVKCAEYKNIGFKLNQWQTVGWWQCNLTEELQSPEEVIPFEEIKNTKPFADITNEGISLVK